MPERPTHWRNYADLTPAEKTRVRKMYTQGDEIMAIAQRCRVYAGSVATAATVGRWTRPHGVASIAKRIAAAVPSGSTMSNVEIADLVGSSPEYVRRVRLKMRRAKKKTTRK